MDYRVIDQSRFHATNLFKLVFVRNEKNKKSISLLKWFKLTILEILFGPEIIEGFISTSSCPSNSNEKNIDYYGREQTLNLHIPNGFFTNLFRKHLVEVLYYKYHLQYAILKENDNPIKDEKLKVINCTGVFFSAFKEMFNQFISLRRVYEFSALVFNISIDLAVYYASERIDIAILSALIIESVRRIIKT